VVRARPYGRAVGLRRGAAQPHSAAWARWTGEGADELTGVTQGKNKRKKNKIQFRTQFDHRSDLLFSPFLKN